MGRYHDNSGIANTCPLINEVIGFIEGQDEDTTAEEKRNILNTLEQVRSMNLSLRDWGNEESRLKEEGEESICDLEKQISELEKEIDSLKYQLDLSEKRVEELEYKINEIN